MVEQGVAGGDGSLTASQQEMVELWERHMVAEFEKHSVEDTLATMGEDPFLLSVALGLGSVGHYAVRESYERVVPQFPTDAEFTTISRTVGNDRIVDEILMTFTHSGQMDWILPGIPATGKRIELPAVVIVEFRGGKMAGERQYWDQGSVLAQAGLIDSGPFPSAGPKEPVSSGTSSGGLVDPEQTPSSRAAEGT